MPNKKTISIVVVVLVVIFAVDIFWTRSKNNVVENNNSSVNVPASGLDQNQAQDSSQNSSASADFAPPLDLAKERVTKKPFGIFITPATSPVQPERFRGYHTGADFEIFPDELNVAVPVKAICAGTVAAKKIASGYGGVLVQNCMLNNAPITVIYGHLNLASIARKIGDKLAVGEVIGNLGKAYSSETDGERKHLHLGMHKGTSVNILGYVQNQDLLSIWLDPCEFVCK